MRRSTFILPAWLLATALAAPAQAENATSPAAAPGHSGQASPLPAADAEFLQKAVIGGMQEVTLGSMAEQNAGSNATRAFGTRMVQDHSHATQQLTQLAQQHGWPVPTSLDAKHQKVVDRMKVLTGAQFDHAYIPYMVQDHQQDIQDFQKEADSGQNSALRAFAQQMVPVLRQHLQLAQTTQQTLGSGQK